MTPRELFRPVYGQHFQVRPKHWWRPGQRHAAKLAAKLLDSNLDLQRRISERVLHQALYGFDVKRWPPCE